MFTEVSSYGLPVITSDSDGIPSVVQNGINGFNFPLGSQTSEQIANKIATIYKDKEQYSLLCHSAVNEHNTRLNWQIAAQKFIKLAEQAIAK